MIIKNVYEENKDDVYRYLVNLTGDSSLSEDLVSETFLAAIKSLHRFKGESSIKTWLFSIARNKWYEYLRKQKPMISIDDLAYRYLKSDFNIEESIITQDIYKKIVSLLDEENEKARNVVLMRIEGYSYLEIANKYSISESSARVIDYRTKKKIQKILRDREGL